MLNTDLPITKASEDMLNRHEFADNLAQAILGHTSPDTFTIGLYGKWGSGKTSLINMMVESIAAMVKDNNVVVLRFNPWLCTDPNQLITQFLKQLSSAIKLKAPLGAKTWAAIDKYADAFGFASLIADPLAGVIVSTTSGLFKRKAKAKVAAQSPDLQSEKDRIAQKLREDKIKIIVAIDDIDRLSETEIIAVFQLVKSLADFPYMFYVLAFDYDVVVKALGEVQKGDGREYLEKIIQVPFELPAPDMDSIHQVLFQRLDSILSALPSSKWEEEIWPDLFQLGIRPYMRTLRDVIRYCNVFSLKYGLLKNETNVMDLLGLTCLQVFEPFVYSHLPPCKSALCGAGFQGLDSLYEEEKKKTEDTLLEILSVALNSEATKSILQVLFPKASAPRQFWVSFGRTFDHKQFLINNNLAHPYCFDRYFSLSLESGSISTVFTEDLIFHAGKDQLLQGILLMDSRGKMGRLLELIDAHTQNQRSALLISERAPLLLDVLVRHWHTLTSGDDDNSLAFPLSWRLLFCVNSLLSFVPADFRYSFMEGLFADRTVPLSTLAYLLRDFEHQHDRFKGKTDPRETSKPKTFPLEMVLALEGLMKTRIIEELDAGILLDEKRPLVLLWVLEQIDPELAAEREQRLVTDDASLAEVIHGCVIHGHVLTSIARPTWNIDHDSLSRFITADEAYQRMCVYANTAEFFRLPIDVQRDVAAFLIFMEHNTTENDDDEFSISIDAIERKLQGFKPC